MAKVSGLTAMIVVALLWGAPMAQSSSAPTTIAEFPGSALPWLFSAQGEIKRRNVDVRKYNVTAIDKAESVFVLLIAPGDPKHVRGAKDGLEIEIRKSDATVIRSYYVR
jgi:hypothetical protein